MLIMETLHCPQCHSNKNVVAGMSSYQCTVCDTSFIPTFNQKFGIGKEGLRKMFGTSFKIGDHMRVKPGYTLQAANGWAFQGSSEITGNEVGTVEKNLARNANGYVLQFTRGRYLNLPSDGKLLREQDESLVLVKARVKK